MTIFNCTASRTHGVCLLFLFWSPSPATSSALLCADVLPHCPSTLGHSPPASSSLLSQHDSSPSLQLYVRCFQACFSHSCWLSQIAWTDLTLGSIPMYSGWSTHSLYAWGRTAGIEDSMDSLAMGWLLLPVQHTLFEGHKLGKASNSGWIQLFLIWLAQTLPLPSAVSTSETLKKQNFSLITQCLCFVDLQGMRSFFDEADGSLCPPVCLWYLDTWFLHLYLWWDAFLPCEWSESRFPF